MPELFHVKPPGEILQVGESRLHVLAEGDGPVVVLCGGLAGNWFDWDDCARHLQSATPSSASIARASGSASLLPKFRPSAAKLSGSATCSTLWD